MNTTTSSPITAAGPPGGPATAPAAHSAPAAGGRHQVPTHLDVEDRPFCGLTVRQVLVLAVGGAWAYAAWCLAPALPTALRAALAGACLLLAATAALGGSGWGLLVLRYATTPRVTVWRAGGARGGRRPARARRRRAGARDGERLGDLGARPRLGAPPTPAARGGGRSRGRPPAGRGRGGRRSPRRGGRAVTPPAPTIRRSAGPGGPASRVPHGARTRADRRRPRRTLGRGAVPPPLPAAAVVRIAVGADRPRRRGGPRGRRRRRPAPAGRPAPGGAGGQRGQPEPPGRARAGGLRGRPRRVPQRADRPRPVPPPGDAGRSGRRGLRPRAAPAPGAGARPGGARPPARRPSSGGWPRRAGSWSAAATSSCRARPRRPRAPPGGSGASPGRAARAGEGRMGRAGRETRRWRLTRQTRRRGRSVGPCWRWSGAATRWRASWPAAGWPRAGCAGATWLASWAPGGARSAPGGSARRPARTPGRGTTSRRGRAPPPDRAGGSQPPRPVADLVAPAAVEVGRDRLRLERAYARVLALTAYPRVVSPGWLAPLLDADLPLELSLHVAPLPTAGRGAATWATAWPGWSPPGPLAERRGRLADPEAEVAAEDVARLRDALQRGEERVFATGLYLLLRAPTADRLDAAHPARRGRPGRPAGPVPRRPSWSRTGACAPAPRWGTTPCAGAARWTPAPWPPPSPSAPPPGRRRGRSSRGVFWASPAPAAARSCSTPSTPAWTTPTWW